jgi:hypothetical protein
MPTFVFSRRLLTIVVAAIIAIAVGLAACVSIQQHIFRWRAEQLLTDIRELQMGKSTWTDTQRLVRQWGAWGSWQGECTQRDCLFEISMEDASHAFHHFPLLHGGLWDPHLSWPQWLSKPYALLGGRFAVVAAEFEVRNGVVRSKSFGMMTALSPAAYDAKQELNITPDTAVVVAAICDTTRFPGGLFSASDPEISLSNYKEGANWQMAQFTPFADENKIRSLMDFNLDCLTRRKECRSTRDLMPTAVSLFATQRSADHDKYPNKLPVWIVAREAQYVAVGAALSSPHTSDRRQSILPMTFKADDLLKGEPEIGVNRSFYMVRTIGSKETCLVAHGDVSRYPPGTRVIMAFNESSNENYNQEADPACIVIPLSDQNLAAVQHGIDRNQLNLSR